MKLGVPRGRISDFTRLVNYINSKFSDCKSEIIAEITAEGGDIAVSDYEDKIKQALEQAGIEIKEEYKE